MQGVFFRDSVRERSRAAGLAGWVRNCPDGTVEAVFEGAEPAVSELLSFCNEGPPRAQVLTVETSEEEPEGLSRFEVR